LGEAEETFGFQSVDPNIVQ